MRNKIVDLVTSFLCKKRHLFVGLAALFLFLFLFSNPISADAINHSTNEHTIGWSCTDLSVPEQHFSPYKSLSSNNCKIKINVSQQLSNRNNFVFKGFKSPVFYKNVLIVDQQAIHSLGIINQDSQAVLSCSYYFLRLNVLSSQAHPPTFSI